jgi:hypothetical protein
MCADELHVCVCVCVCVWSSGMCVDEPYVRACVRVCVRACVRVCVHVHTHTYVCIYIYNVTQIRYTRFLTRYITTQIRYTAIHNYNYI